MTLPWDNHEAKIRELYAKHTLKTVRETMQREDGFAASVRAYRKKLDEWGMAKYKPRENKSRNSPGKEPPRNEATNQQYPSNPGPSGQTSYDSPHAMINPRETSWVQTQQPSYYNVAGWSQTTSYGQPMMTPNYGHQSTMDSNSMGQEQWYSNYQVSPPYTVTGTTTASTADWNVSQAPTNTSMMEFQANANDEYEDEEEEEEEAQYQDSSERSPTPGNE